jgi:lipopolysaccharide transport system permease protein
MTLPSPLEPFAAAWRERRLISRLARREIEARYRGSLLGIAWSVITPLLMLAVYTFAFSVVFRARWGERGEGRAEFALILFAGLVTFGLFSECVNRAPGLVLENVSYVKKVVFPLESLAWVALAGALFNTAIGVLLLLAGLALAGVPPRATSLLLPLLLLPPSLLALGLTWFLCSIGVFVRDVRQVVPIATTSLLFLSPVFFPASAVPEPYRALLLANPLAPAIEATRGALVFGRPPDWPSFGLSLALSALACWLGFTWFANTRRGFADVV